MRHEEEIMFEIDELEMIYNNIESASIIKAVSKSQIDDLVEKEKKIYNMISDSLESFKIDDETSLMLKDRVKLMYLKHDEVMKTIVFYR